MASGAPEFSRHAVKKRRPSDWLFWAVKAKGLSTGSKLVLVCLADLADEHGRSYPGHEYLADLCGCTRRSVITYLERLAAGGWITIEHRQKSGLRTSNIYTLNAVKIFHSARCENFAWGGENFSSSRCEKFAQDTPTLLTLPHTQEKSNRRPDSTRSTSIRDDLSDTSWATGE